MSIPESVLRNDYEIVREQNPDAGLKPYDDLSDEEKARHEAIYRRTASFFNALGEAIRSGGPLPNPLTYEEPVE